MVRTARTRHGQVVQCLISVPGIAYESFMRINSRLAPTEGVVWTVDGVQQDRKFRGLWGTTPIFYPLTLNGLLLKGYRLKNACKRHQSIEVVSLSYAVRTVSVIA